MTKRRASQWAVAKFSGQHAPKIANLLDVVVVVVLATSNVIHIQRAL